MRLIARLPDQRQVGALVDSLKAIGVYRKDMIISDMTKEQKFDNVQEATNAGVSLINSERDGLGELEPFWKGIDDLKGDTGIIVAVEIPKHEYDQVKIIMEQSGAVEIVKN